MSTVDILPTLLDVIGAVMPAGWTDGQSLLAAEGFPDRVVLLRTYERWRPSITSVLRQFRAT